MIVFFISIKILVILFMKGDYHVPIFNYKTRCHNCVRRRQLLLLEVQLIL